MVKVGAIDCGSNSTRLLISNVENGRLENLLKQHEIEGQTAALADKYDEAAFASDVDQLDETGALEFYVLSGRPLPKSRQGVIPAGELNGANFAQYLKIVRAKDKKAGTNTPFETIVAEFRAKAA